MSEVRLTGLRSLVAAMAMDIWDEHTLVEHIYSIGLGDMADDLCVLVADHFGLQEQDGSYTPQSFLDSLHTVRGISHLSIIDSLRDLASEIDPDRDWHIYGSSRLQPFTPAGG